MPIPHRSRAIVLESGICLAAGTFFDRRGTFKQLIVDAGPTRFDLLLRVASRVVQRPAGVALQGVVLGGCGQDNPAFQRLLLNGSQ